MAGETPPPAFLTAMEHVYGSIRSLSNADASSWTPPPMSEGHKGRYLWTDSFGVVNLLTLYKTKNDERYLSLARQLIHKVHSILGFTRDGSARLPGASEEWPLRGGLRIGKEDESGPDGDGQYHHYLTMWMFALSRMTLASGDPWYNEQAVSLAETIHPRFVYPAPHGSGGRPRMVWKMSMDLSHPLVRSEGNLDPMDGFVVFSLLRQVAASNILEKEIGEYKRIVDTKWKGYSSDDPLDLGMTLWTAHWFKGEQTWATGLADRAVEDLDDLFEQDYFEVPTRYRLAFREFGTCLGIRSHNLGPGWDARARQITSAWERAKLVPDPAEEHKSGLMNKLLPITLVMYATALYPGGFRKGFFDS
ncbi:hypothetical protein L228DRAFT_241921 [Xylona heveae TC161]|uniref:Uncharacterized protein n=1 Tax=Xylona heveae (strain CBS 132557 / TC161) TaxID=1328760 RepID=A0A164ZM10_XYLHT|nr:hypothetical protein L228DRAFT_241921 [Xylona heveae TC161]KZF19261.1 hypothetical protein L228DRAFT_241921 [Xylona heveae TC161]